MLKKRWSSIRDLFSGGAQQQPVNFALTVEDVVWVMGSFCALSRKPFDPELLIRQFPPPYTTDSLIHAARALGFKIKRQECDTDALSGLHFPCLILLDAPLGDVADNDDRPHVTQRLIRPAVLVQIQDDNFIVFYAGSNEVTPISRAEFNARYQGVAFQLALETTRISDPDNGNQSNLHFGFRWFIPELLKHKKVWRDVLIASLVIQLLALGTPLFTQVVIDKGWCITCKAPYLSSPSASLCSWCFHPY